ncbi:MAG: DUF3037 domain-containing protein [Prosthecobacter sp.]|uniref:DUF3037 domain-containing protein n=1 Tax=Prosthecobacter sp. TaxID=1965333 RepID=UPI0038FFF3B7
MNPAPHVCNYAVLRYLPYPETGEFVNVGVVVHCPELGWFGHASYENDMQRVLRFFPAVDRATYQAGRKAIIEELERVRALIHGTTDRRQARGIFDELVRTRESVFRFGEMRSAMADDPEAFVQQLCEQYVKPRRVSAASMAA